MTVAPAARSSRAHLVEIDFLRFVTMLGVVTVHVLAFTVAFNGTASGSTIQNGFVSTFHFTREVFMFTSGLVLTYTYYGKLWDWRRFWTRRGLSIVLPYVLWSAFYVWVSAPQPMSPAEFSWSALGAILTGTASYQLYYLLVIFQFYLVLPWFLRALKRVERHLWKILAVSFVLQVIVLYFDFRYVQALPPNAPQVARWLAVSQERLLPLYQFYFLFGAVVALRLETIKRFVTRHVLALSVFIGGTFAALWLHYGWLVYVQRAPVAYAISVIQPIMVFYSVAIIVLFYLLARRWAGWVTTSGRRWVTQLNTTFANASFGIYLVHPFLTTVALQRVVPSIPTAWPVPLRVFLVWLGVSIVSLVFSALLCQVPVLSRIVGQNKPLPAWDSRQPSRRARLDAALAVATARFRMGSRAQR